MVCRGYLGDHGNEADLDQLQGSYGSASTDIERAEIIAALRRMEKSRRNDFYRRCSTDRPIIVAAIAAAKGGEASTRQTA